MKGGLKKLAIIAASSIVLAFGSVASAKKVNWDFPLAWPDGNFHTKNAKVFAEEVEKATDGRVKITIHSGGSLGFKGPEMLTAVRDGLVPIGDVYLNQQIGEAPILGLEAIPYIVADYDELKTLHKSFRPVVEEVAKKYNQKILYMVPWPSPYVYTKKKIENLGDLKGIKIRTYNKTTTELFNAVGMTSVQLPWGEVVPSLAAGTIDGVTTSASSGVDGKFWEFLKYMYPTNHVWASDAITVNLDAWNELSEQDRKIVAEVAMNLEPKFWEVSRLEDEEKTKILNDNGVMTGEVNEEMMKGMRAATSGILEDFVKKNPDAKAVLDEYFSAVGRK